MKKLIGKIIIAVIILAAVVVGGTGLFIGLFLGIIAGLVFLTIGKTDFTVAYIKPFGTIFLNLMKLLVHLQMVLFHLLTDQ